MIDPKKIAGYQRIYRATHRKQHNEYNRRWRQAHPENGAEQKRRYREDHHDEIVEWNRQYYISHREERTEYQRRYREANIEQVRAKANEKNRQWRLANLDKVAEYNRQWQTIHPGAAIAHHVIGHRIERGKIIRPNVCEVCGGSSRIDGHHPTYTRPLEVIWVCKSCHRKLHLRKKHEISETPVINA